MFSFKSSLKILIFLFIIFIGLFTLFYNTETNIELQIKKIFPENLRNVIKSTIFLIPEKNREIILLNDEIDELKEKILNIKYDESIIDLEDSYVTLFNYYSNNLKKLKAKKSKTIINEIKGSKLQFDFYSINNLFNGKHSTANATIYLEYKDKNVILVSGDGHFFYFNKNKLKNDVIEFTKIQTNIHDIITDIDFLTKSKIGIKDVLIDGNNILITFPIKKKEDCYSFSIFRSKFNLNYLKFNKLYETKPCVNRRESNHFGGRIKVLNQNNYIFTTGDYGTSNNSQITKNLYGKIIKINKINNQTEIISLGHRNPQGLYIDNEKGKILSTEHGPTGGDEINMIDLKNNKIKNYGWPKSSYGIDQDAPWKRNHIEYGYIEPIKYYVPSIAISEIIKVPEKFFNSDNNFFVASMGGIPDGGYQSIHYINLDENYQKINDERIIKINDRVRDLINLNDDDIVLGSTEMSPGIFKISISED